jgi:hypothetical protein
MGSDRIDLCDLPGRVELGEMGERTLELQLLETRRDIEIVLELDRALSAEIDFAEDRVCRLARRVVSHLNHRVEEVGSGDSGVVVKVKLLKLGAEVGDLVGRELGAGEKGGVRLGHTQGLDAALGSDNVLEGEVGLLLIDVSGGS